MVGAGKRWWNHKAVNVLSVMVFWGQMQNYMMRLNLGILIVAMVDDTKGKNVTVGENCGYGADDISSNSTSTDAGTSSGNEDEIKFEWDEVTRGHILGAFFYGYLTTQIIGGRLTEYFGIKVVYGASLGLTAVGTLLSPVVARWHYTAFIALRIFQGVCEGATFPALHPMTARWVPVEDRSSFIARSFFGSVIGNVVTFPLCGVLVDSYGWPSAFYVIGSITLVWLVFWCLLVYDSPEKHPYIGDEERQYVREKLPDSGDKKPLPVPWKSIFTSAPFFALAICDAANTFGANIFFSNFSSYLKYMLGVDIKTNGLLSSLPYLCRYLGGVVSGRISDELYERKVLRLVTIRRIFNSISKFVPAVALVLLAWSGCDVGYVMFLVCVGFFFNGALSSGHFASYLDLAPNFSGTIFGISNTFSGGGTGFIVPLIIGALTQGGHSFGTWRAIFLLGAAVYALGGAVYIPFIRAEPQPWNSPAAPLAEREGRTRTRNEDEKCDGRRIGDADEKEEQF